MSARPAIWVIEDSPLDAERARQTLCDGHDIDVFSDAAAAVERIATRRAPDLVVVGWVLPGMSGLDFCRWLRSAPGEAATTPVVVLTSQHGVEQVLEGFQAGADDCVSKPYVGEELRARVTALLRARAIRRRAEAAEADLRSLLANTPDALLAADVHGRIAYVNAEAAHLLDRPVDSLIGQRVSDLLPQLALGHLPDDAIARAVSLPDVELGGRVLAPLVRRLDGGDIAMTIALRDLWLPRTGAAEVAGPRTILVVDDDADLRAAVVEFLQNIGFATLEAENGREAWHLLERGPRPSLIVLDMAMPVMSGAELLQQIAAHDHLDNLPVIVLSGERNLREPRASCILRKPFDPDDLMRAIRGGRLGV